MGLQECFGGKSLTGRESSGGRIYLVKTKGSLNQSLDEKKNPWVLGGKEHQEKKGRAIF